MVLEAGLTIAGKSMREHFEVIGHSKAYDFLFELAKGQGITEANICQLHKLFYQQIDESNAGAYRTVPVVITGSNEAFPKPDQLSKLMADLIPTTTRYAQELHLLSIQLV